LVQNIDASKRAGIAGMSIVYDPQIPYGLYVLVEVHASVGMPWIVPSSAMMLCAIELWLLCAP
jgi:hypothetical protein